MPHPLNNFEIPKYYQTKLNLRYWDSKIKYGAI